MDIIYNSNLQGGNVTTFILLSGGVGTRMQHTIPKQYLLLAGKPMIMHTLERCNQIKDLEKIVIVCSSEYIGNIQLMVQQYNITIPIEYAEAGNTRQSSVYSGLNFVNTESVIIHESARPFVSIEEFKTLIDASEENVTYGVKIPFTVLKGKNYISSVLNREELVNIQLPQKFNTQLLRNAHFAAQKDGKKFTEDASQIFFYYPNTSIKILEGKDYNIKITTPTDMLTGEIIYKEFFAGRK